MRRSDSWRQLVATTAGGKKVEQEERRAEPIVDHRFRFMNIEQELPRIDWSAEYVSPLWTYHLHYFDYSVDLARAWRATDDRQYGDRYLELWNSWLDAAGKGRARIEPYPTSVRCLNALQSLWLVEDRLPDDFVQRLLGSIHAQLDWLADNLERHLRANHLQKNLTALSWGSLAFAGDKASGWSRYRAELWRELREQVLPDGGHFERSPMYHAAALDDFLRTLALCRAADVAVPDDIPERLATMTYALQRLSRPEGELHLFNDAANGERPDRSEVLDRARIVLAAEFPEPSGDFALSRTGYFGTVNHSEGRRLVIDAGPLGPSYQPGHAHCDMLSFELDLAGRPVVVDAGVHGYDGDPYREYVRSTRAHNTVSINGRDQHEMWATFRVARRGGIIDADCDEIAEGFEFQGACRHYHDKTAVHLRTILFRGDELTVTDRVEGADDCELKSWLHLHPDFRLEPLESGFLAVHEDHTLDLRVRIVSFGGDRVLVRQGERDPIQGWHCPRFGVALPAPAIELTIPANDGRMFGWRIERVPAH